MNDFDNDSLPLSVLNGNLLFCLELFKRLEEKGILSREDSLSVLQSTALAIRSTTDGSSQQEISEIVARSYEGLAWVHLKRPKSDR